MFRLDHPLKSPLFDYYSPLNSRYLGLVSIPHSGDSIPDDFQEFLSGDELAYREDLDFKVNELVDIEALQKAGIGVIISNVHRICVDLNRSEGNCVMFWKQNTHGKTLVAKDPSAEVMEKFIETYHRPYYEVMKTFLRDMEKKIAGPVNMIDLHSMPSKITAYHLKMNPNQKDTRPDFCLSDLHGKTCTPEFIHHFKKDFEERGYSASINDPYVGGHITEWVNGFRTNNIQIEVNRSVYMDEINKALIPDKVSRLKPQLTEMFIKGFEKFLA